MTTNHSRSLLRKALVVPFAIGLFAALAPSCGSGCPDGQIAVCNVDGACSCGAPCTTYKDCDAADPTSARYCDGYFQACLPKELFTNQCGGIPCTGGECQTTTNACVPFCRHSSECASGCCYVTTVSGESPNPHCSLVMGAEGCLP